MRESVSSAHDGVRVASSSPNGGVLHRERMRFERNFTQLPNQWLRDRMLSRGARGLLAELMTHDIGHDVSIQGLAAAGLEGRDLIRKYVAELEGRGYLTRHRERRGGRLGGTRWILSDPWDVVSEAPALPGLERSTYVGSTYVGGANVGRTYVGATASVNPTTIEDQVKKINGSLPSATIERPVDNFRRGVCGHKLVDDRHCEYGCPAEAVAS